VARAVLGCCAQIRGRGIQPGTPPPARPDGPGSARRRFGRKGSRSSREPAPAGLTRPALQHLRPITLHSVALSGKPRTATAAAWKACGNLAEIYRPSPRPRPAPVRIRPCSRARLSRSPGRDTAAARFLQAGWTPRQSERHRQGSSPPGGRSSLSTSAGHADLTAYDRQGRQGFLKASTQWPRMRAITARPSNIS